VLHFIEEKSEDEVNKEFKSDFICLINGIAPHILYVQDDSWEGIDATGRKVVHQE
jgi:hypothetical protein